jgi:pimeloyl-ACP methyl ester carboxylesterase
MSLELPDVRTLDIDGPVAFREWDGPPEATFVLIHGLGGSHLNWIQVAPGLAGLGRVLALDLPGFGGSPLAARGARLMDQRRLLDRFIEERVQGRVVLCGNSMGGALALLEAGVAPQRADGLILTCSAFPRVGRSGPHPLVRGAFALYDTPGLGVAAVRARLRALTPERIVSMGLQLTCADPRSIPPGVVALHVELVRRHLSDPEGADAFIGAARSMLALGRRPEVVRRALDAVRCPVLILHGRRDRLVPARDAEEVLARYPAWRGRFFPDLGHVPQMEAPGRWLAEVADWSAAALDRT